MQNIMILYVIEFSKIRNILIIDLINTFNL